MALRNSASRYGVVAQTLHWIVAGLIGYQYVLATRAADATLFQKLGILATHKSVGLTILVLVMVRLAWNLGTGRPRPPAGEPAYRIVLARTTHGALYALMIAMPLTGWIMSSAANTPVSYFGALTMPNLVSPHPDWVDALVSVHGGLFVVLVTVVAVHAAAALYHHLYLRDDVLRRMIPFLGHR